jgi:hypothetical protein
VQVSWQPVVVAGGDEVEYMVSGWKDGAGEPVTLYKGQLTSCLVTTETLCRGHTHQVAVCACASGESGELSQREAAATIPRALRTVCCCDYRDQCGDPSLAPRPASASKDSQSNKELSGATMECSTCQWVSHSGVLSGVGSEQR